MDFHLEISGTRNIKQELEEVSDRLQRLAAIANALDGKDVDIEANVDKNGSLDQTLETVRTLDGFEFDADGSSLSRELERSLDDVEFDPEVDAASIRSQIKAAVETGDFDADVDANLVGSRLAGGLADTDVDRDTSGGLSSVSSALQGQSLSEDLSRLNDEAFALASIFSRVSATGIAVTGTFTTLIAATGVTLGAVGALGTAATALATKFGDKEIRSSLSRLKGVFQGVARAFVDAFEPIIKNQIIPAARTFATELQNSIPQLRNLAQRFLPSLLSAILGLIDNIVDIVQVSGALFSAFDLAIETVEIVVEAIPAAVEGILDFAPNKDIPDFFRRSLDESFQSLSNSLDQISRSTTGEGLSDRVTSFFVKDPQTPQEQLRKEIERVLGGDTAKAFGESLNLDTGLQKIREIQREIEATEGLEEKFQLANKALKKLRQKGLTDTEQFKNLEETLADIRARAEEAGIQLEESLGSGLERPENTEEGGIVDNAIEQFREFGRRVENDISTPTEAAKNQIRVLENALNKLSDQGRGSSEEFKFLNQALTETENRLRRLNSIDLSNVGEAEIDADTGPVTGVGQAERAPASSVTDFSRDPLERVRDLFRAGVITQLEAARQKVSALEGQIKSALNRGFEPSSKKVGQLRNRLAQARAELQQMTQDAAGVDTSFSGFNETLREAVRNAASLGERLGNAVTGFADQLSQGIGQSVGDALFADQGRLNRLRGRRRQIQQNLRQARRAGNVQQIRQLSSELDRVNQKLNQSKTLAGRLGRAFRNFGQVAKQALESFVSQVVQAIAKIAALKIISSFLTLGAPPVPGAVGQVGAGLEKFIPGAASGGFVEEGGLARIHKGETIIPKGGGMAPRQLDAGTASLNGDTIEIPVRMINDGNRIGSRNKGRAGRA
ncbi:archaellum component FlaC [Salinibacter ruber]|nr:archaellum component FlaC [Salinibacter ruber]